MKTQFNGRERWHDWFPGRFRLVASDSRSDFHEQNFQQVYVLLFGLHATNQVKGQVNQGLFPNYVLLDAQNHELR